MNYVIELNLFDEFLKNHQLSTGQIALWYALMQISNKNYWPEWIDIKSSDLEIRTGLGRYGIRDARKKLEELGLIKTKSNKTKATSYHLISLTSLQNTTQDIQQVEVKKTSDITQYFQQDNATFSTSLRNIFNKTTQHFQQVETGSPLIARGRIPPKTKTKTINNIYNKKFCNYNQRSYSDSTLESFYCNNNLKER